jgi:ABC-type bacteriocin/lantibiotic exporter with double-glycine peptidase domain
MVLDYLQVPVDYRALLKLLNVREFGTSFLSLQNIERLGLHVLTLEGDMPMLDRWLQQGLPSIVAVSTGQLASYWMEDTDHAVVVIGMDKDFIIIQDPDQATGPQQVNRAEFESAWLEQNYWCAAIGLDTLEE